MCEPDFSNLAVCDVLFSGSQMLQLICTASYCDQKKSGVNHSAAQLGESYARVRIADLVHRTVLYPPSPMLTLANGPWKPTFSDLRASIPPSIAPKKKSPR